MANTRKRKNAPTEDNAATTIKRQKGIQSFGNIGKSRPAAHIKDDKPSTVRLATPPANSCPRKSTARPDSKRKRAADSDSEDEPATAKPSIFKQFAKKEKTVNKRVKQQLPPTPDETPRSKAATALFDRLQLDPNGAIPFTFSQKKLFTPPDTPEGERKALQLDLTEELQELQTLYASFLTALSLQNSHNRSSSTADIVSLLPMITKNWKKRAVTLEDMRRVLAVDSKCRNFALEDCGRAGVRLTVAQSGIRKHISGFVDEDDLNQQFDQALRARWADYTVRNSEATGQDFVKRLPLLDLLVDESTKKTAPLFERGKQRLADVKADRAATMAHEAAKSTTLESASKHKTVEAVQNRGTSLLDRVLAKQTLRASLSAGPTREQLERRSALHRIEDVTRVLGLLAGTKARITFSMPTVTQQLQQSLRNPISRDEVERCLKLMASEISPEFARVVKMGEVQGVIITTVGKVGLEELRRRVAAAEGV